jgi:hypothetical protein
MLVLAEIRLGEFSLDGRGDKKPMLHHHCGDDGNGGGERGKVRL